MIRNSEHLTGFTDREIELIAQIARYHRKSDAQGEAPGVRRAGATRTSARPVLAGLLRVAIALDRTTRHRSHSVSVEDLGDRLEVRATPAGDADIGLELYATAART